MYSLNVSVPPAVDAVQADVADSLEGFDHREDPSILLKRVDPQGRSAEGYRSFDALTRRVRDVLDGAPTFAARLDGIGTFDDPPTGSEPVVYLGVESPGLTALHQRVCESIPPVPDLEGPGYVPHVTVGRGGPERVAAAVAERSLPDIEWTVEEIHLYDARHGESIRSYPLPYHA